MTTARDGPGILRARLPVVALIAFATFLGLWAGLVLLGWSLPVVSVGFPDWHGPLMVNGVLATLIVLERAVALRRAWAFAAPVVSGGGTLALLTPLGPMLGGVFWIVSGLLLTAVFLEIHRRQPGFHSAVLTTAAALLFFGNLTWWATGDVPAMVLWWVSFLVLLIAGERLELSRVFRLTLAKRVAFGVGAAMLVVGPVLSTVTLVPAIATEAAGLVTLGVWLLLYDVARANLPLPGRPRFLGLCLVSGYAWIVFAGALALGTGASLPGLVYDAFLHAIFIGFVFTMIMAHALVILQAFLGRSVPFTRAFYVPLVLIEGTLALRVASDLAGWDALRMWAGLLNVVAILSFVLVLGGNLARDRLRWIQDLFHPDFMNVR